MPTEETSDGNKKFYFHPELVRTRKTKKEIQTKDYKEKAEVPQKEIVFKQQESGSGYTGLVFTCPLTNVNFRGGCPIIPCHANITNYKPERSCCLHIEARKSEFDKWDLQQYLGIKEAKLYKYRETGENKVTSVVLLSKLINHLRENCHTEKPTKNLSDYANFINKSNLGLHEINPHLSDVLLIKNNLDKVYEFLKNSGKQDLPLAEFLGTDEPFPE